MEKKFQVAVIVSVSFWNVKYLATVHTITDSDFFYAGVENIVFYQKKLNFDRSLEFYKMKFPVWTFQSL